MANQRSLNVTKLIDDCEARLSDLVKWPESEAIKKEVDVTVKALRKLFREDSYPDVFLYMTASKIATCLFFESVNRDVKLTNYKLAWLKLSELFD